MKIVFTGGGTAGHIFPIIAVCREMKKIDSNLQFFYIGPKDDFSEKLLSQEGIEIKIIMAGKIRRYINFKSIFQNIIDLCFKNPIGFFQALFHIFVLSPDLIFSKGGYGSLPVVFSGWLLLVPVFLHESDIVPGLANRIASHFSLEVFVSFPVEKTEYFPAKKMIFLGNPIRNEILNGDRERAKKSFNLSGEKPIILILGGSQGSQRINEVISFILPGLLTEFEIIHQTGAKNFKEIELESKTFVSKELLKYYHVFPFLEEENLKDALAVASLIISRAGAGIIFEIAVVGKPSILIPLAESAQNHQLKNAYAYAECGAALVIEENNFTPNFFLERVKYLLSQPERLKKMSESAKFFAKPLSAKIIAQYLIDYLKQ